MIFEHKYQVLEWRALTQEEFQKTGIKGKFKVEYTLKFDDQADFEPKPGYLEKLFEGLGA